MFYIERGENGRIVALHKDATQSAAELKSVVDEEVMEFFESSDSWKQLMAMTDLATVRILEDLIDILIRKNILQFTELPEHAQERIRERKQLREKIVAQGLLVDDII